MPRARALQEAATAMRSLHTTTLELTPLATTREKAHTAIKTQHSQNIYIYKYNFKNLNASDATQALTTFIPHGVSAQRDSQALPLKKHPLCGKKPLRNTELNYSSDLPIRVLHREVL